jgi:hypothetical protein
VQGIDERVEGALRHALGERGGEVQHELRALAPEASLEPGAQPRHGVHERQDRHEVARERHHGQRRQPQAQPEHEGRRVRQQLDQAPQRLGVIGGVAAPILHERPRVQARFALGRLDRGAQLVGRVGAVLEREHDAPRVGVHLHPGESPEGRRDALHGGGQRRELVRSRLAKLDVGARAAHGDAPGARPEQRRHRAQHPRRSPSAGAVRLRGSGLGHDRILRARFTRVTPRQASFICTGKTSVQAPRPCESPAFWPSAGLPGPVNWSLSIDARRSACVSEIPIASIPTRY